MDAIGDAIGEAFAAATEHPVVAIMITIAGAYVVVVWLASALWAFVDMRRRTKEPSVAYAAAAFIVLASPVLFVPALAIHRIVRPAEFVSDRRLSRLRDEALEIEATVGRCPDCNRVVEDDWLICPSCRRALGHRCPACDGTVGLEWPVCAWCGEELDGERPTGLALRA